VSDQELVRWAITIALGAFTLGLWLGGWLRDRQWRAVASGEPRHESGGKLYHVIEDGDLRKVSDVQGWISADVLRARTKERIE
jgi:hypothetical protein